MVNKIVGRSCFEDGDMFLTPQAEGTCPLFKWGHVAGGCRCPLAQQDMAQLGRIQGFEPVILEIKAVTALPILSELQEKLQTKPAVTGVS